jgi:hypothetical protein
MVPLATATSTQTIDIKSLQTQMQMNKIVTESFAKFAKLPDTIQFTITDGKREVILDHKSLLGFVNNVKDPKMKSNLLKFFSTATLNRLAMMQPGQYTKISLNDVMAGKEALPKNEPKPVASSDLMPKPQQNNGKVAVGAMPVMQMQQMNGKKVQEAKTPTSAGQTTDEMKVSYTPKFILSALEEWGLLSPEAAETLSQILG